MNSDGARDAEYFLMSVRPPDVATTGVDVEWNLLRDLPAHEWDLNSKDSALLRELVSESPVLRVERDASRVAAAMQAYVTAERAHDVAQEMNVREAFSDWLRSVRRHDDVTSSWLTRRFGSGTQEVADFKAALTTEYDRNFGYRLVSALRNKSEHTAARVLNEITMSTESSADHGLLRSVVVGVDPQRLVADLPDLKATVRDELAQVTDSFAVLPLLETVTESCARAHLYLLQALWPSHVEPSIGRVTRMHMEATRRGDIAAIMTEGAPTHDQGWKIQYVQYELAMEAADRRLAALRAFARPAGPVHPEDLVTAALTFYATQDEENGRWNVFHER